MEKSVLHKSFKKILEETLKILKNYYGERLVSVVVYGSVGRGTQRFDSDIDLLLVVKNLPKGRFARIEEFREIEKMLEPFLSEAETRGIYTEFSPLIKTPDEVKSGSPLFLDMIDDAKILYDKNEFFKNFLEDLRKRLNRLGARRIWLGNSWYWDLKPDYKPGEVFKI
ncbi:nucleotidyltransferase domain-containing protein [Thermodesulfovibrio hydrogeniphilus]